LEIFKIDLTEENKKPLKFVLSVFVLLTNLALLDFIAPIATVAPQHALEKALARGVE
jgi:hypothetical protein